MGFYKFLKFPQKSSKSTSNFHDYITHHRLSLNSTSISHHGSLTIPSVSSQITKPYLIFPQIQKIQPIASQISYRSIHTSLIKTQLFISTDQQNPCSDLPDKTVQDAQKICKILSTHSPVSSCDAFLGSAMIEVSPALVMEVLKKLSNAGVIALSFFRWAEKQEGFKYSTESFTALIGALGKIKQFKMIWNLVNDMKNKKLLTKDTFSLITRLYARVRKVKEAIETFEKMEKFGLKIEVSDFNKLLDTLSKSRHVKDAQEMFDKMKVKRFKPDVKSFTVLLEGWGQQQNLLRLNEVYREMVECSIEPDVVAYGIIINAHCKARKPDEAIDWFNQMEAKKVKASPHIYCSLINGLGTLKRLDDAIHFFQRYKMDGFEPEIPTYNALVGAYCWSERIHDAYNVIDEMKQCEVGPNARTYDILLFHLIKAKRAKEAYGVFENMSSENGCEPCLSTYEIIIRMFCNEGRLDMALKVWYMMRERGVIPGMHMFSTLVNSLCHENRLDEASKYFHEMMDAGIRPPSQMFSYLKQALLDDGKQDVVITLGLRIDKLRKTPLLG